MTFQRDDRLRGCTIEELECAVLTPVAIGN